MEKYVSRSGKKSGVIGYEFFENGISVQFEDGDIYDYSYNGCSAMDIENMRNCALEQLGLSTYVSTNRKHLKHDRKR